MKAKILSILLCGFLLLGLTGCGNSNKQHEYDYYTRDDGTRVWFKK